MTSHTVAALEFLSAVSVQLSCKAFIFGPFCWMLTKFIALLSAIILMFTKS